VEVVMVAVESSVIIQAQLQTALTQDQLAQKVLLGVLLGIILTAQSQIVITKVI